MHPNREPPYLFSVFEVKGMGKDGQKIDGWRSCSWSIEMEQSDDILDGTE